MRRSKLVSHEQLAVKSAKADRLSAVAFKQLDQAFIHLSGEHHLNDFDSLLVGHAHSVLELALFAHRVKHRVDLRSAAVNQNNVDPHKLHKHQIAHDRSL